MTSRERPRPALTSSLVIEDRVVRLVLAGAADTSVEAELSHILGRVHGESLQIGAREVVVDLRALESLNSTCFKCFLTWIGAVRRSAHDQHYPIRFMVNQALRWQQRSLHALVYFGGDLVELES